MACSKETEIKSFLFDLEIKKKTIFFVNPFSLIYWVHHLTFIVPISAYFMNDNTQLMSDLTDNQIYSSGERMCLCIRLNFALLSGSASDLQKMPICPLLMQCIPFGYIYHIYIIGHYNPTVRIIDLVSHTTYVVCVNFLHKWRGPTV